MKFDCLNGRDLPENLMHMLERAAEELLLKIEEEENGRLRKSEAQNNPVIHNQIATGQLCVRKKSSHGEKHGKSDLSHERIAENTLCGPIP
jgi:hypothetical protein